MTSPGQRITSALSTDPAHRDTAGGGAGRAEVPARASLPQPAQPAEPAEPAGPAPAYPDAVITSFGYLHGPAPLAEITVDVRTHLRDPHSDPHLRELTGHDRAVQARVLATYGARELIDGLTTATQALLTGPGSGHQPVRVALGCAGGRHRSVVLAEEIAARLTLAGWQTTTTHLDIHQPVVTRQPPTTRQD